MKTKLYLKIYYSFFLSLLTIFIISGCYSDEPGKPEEDNSKKFGIYLLEDQSITWESLKGKNLDSLKLKEWITEDMIDFYDYSSHVIYLNVDYNTLLNFAHNDNTPFVVVANNKICYSGCFAPPQDTTEPHVIFTPLDLCTDLVMLEFNPPHRKDIRINDDVKTALTDAGKIKLGIKHDIYNLDYFEYGNTTYNLLFLVVIYDCNNYEDKHVYPPNVSHCLIKVGNKEYITKLVIYNENSYYSLPTAFSRCDSPIVSASRVLDAENTWNDLYFFVAGQEKHWGERSGHLFPIGLPNGVYNCFVEYYGMMGGPKENRKIYYDPSGRMWMGYLRSNTIQIEYDSTKGEHGITVMNMNVILE